MCLRARWSPSVPGVSIVNIARCAEHGLHGERHECFVCGGEVEQVAMIAADYFSRDELDWLEEAASRAAMGALSRTHGDGLSALARKLAHLACGPSVPA